MAYLVLQVYTDCPCPNTVVFTTFLTLSYRERVVRHKRKFLCCVQTHTHTYSEGVKNRNFLVIKQGSYLSGGGKFGGGGG